MAPLAAAFLLVLSACRSHAAPQAKPEDLTDNIPLQTQINYKTELLEAADLVKKRVPPETLERRLEALSGGDDKKAAALQAALLQIRNNYRQLYGVEPEMRRERPDRPGRDERPGPRPGRQQNNPLADLRDMRNQVRFQRNPKDPDVLGDRGLDLYYAKRLDEAGPLLGAAVKGGVQDSRVYTAYGSVAYEAKDFSTAADMAKRALDLDPSDQQAQALLKLSHSQPSVARANAALEGADNGGKLSPDSRFGQMLQAAQMPDGTAAPQAPRFSVLDEARRAELAAIAARQSVAPPTKVEQSAALTRQAEGNLRIGDYNGAASAASGAIELNNSNAQAWNYRAMAQSNLKQYDKAVYDATYAVTLEPNQAAPWVTRSWAFAKQGLYKEAEQDARMALEKAPGNAYAYHDLAYALAGQGQQAGAREALRLAAQQDPRFKDKYQAALQLAGDADMTMLFADAPVAASAPAGPRSAQSRFVRLVVFSLSGGLLVALGLLQIFAAGWRDKLTQTVRRALAAAPGASGRTASGGFWAQYEMVREIGSGGMGVVFEARDRTLDRRVAVKRMRDEIRSDPAERARFVQEARTVAKLHHPNIVEIYAIVEQDDDVFLVFEFIDGPTLAETLRKGPLSFSQVRKVLAGICAAVDFAHGHGVIHRDLKPSNIMIAGDGNVKVMDFGVARQAKEAMTKLSMTNTVVGTPPYMAPEQEQGTVRRESDLFALGVVLYEAVSGRLPFAGVGAGMLLNKINGRYEPLVPGPAVPPGLPGVLARALAPEPDRRYHSAAELQAAVDGLAAPAAA